MTTLDDTSAQDAAHAAEAVVLHAELAAEAAKVEALKAEIAKVQEEGEAERAELAALRQELAQLASAVHDRLARGTAGGDIELDDLKANLARLMDKLAERK